MTRLVIAGSILLVTCLLFVMAGCDKERIVESTEHVHDIEYVELPPDTVMQIDTLFRVDTITTYSADTVLMFDTVVQVTNTYDTVLVMDTVETVQHHYDTTTITDTVFQVTHLLDTVFVHDTVVTVQHHYDTVVVTDTVETIQCLPNEHFAFAALHYYCDPLVLDLVNQEFGIADGWVLYLSEFQSDLTRQSSTTYDIYGYIDYWTPDWSAYYPLEYYWRLTYVSGDPADVRNWQLSEVPGAVSGRESGVRLRRETAQAQRLHK